MPKKLCVHGLSGNRLILFTGIVDGNGQCKNGPGSSVLKPILVGALVSVGHVSSCWVSCDSLLSESAKETATWNGLGLAIIISRMIMMAENLTKCFIFTYMMTLDVLPA
jgi:hypothetical protein